MNKFILIFLCIICNYSFSQWRATTPIRIDIKDITFTDQYTGYALGRQGNFPNCVNYFALYKTIDAGENWVKMKTGTAGDSKRALHFVNPMVGWIAEESSEVLKTTDGGVTWISQTSGVGTVLNDIWFRDLNNGFLVGNNGMLQKTTNGGSSWTTISSGVTATLSRIYFQSNNLGFITCSNGQVLRTTNGGTSWSAINTGATTLYDVCFTSSTVGYAVGSAAGVFYLYTTVNGGLTWTSNNIGPYIMSRVFFSSPNVGYIKTNVNGIIKTTDGGLTWTPTTSTMNGISDYWFEMYFTDDNTGFLCGNYGKINKTTDGGITWENKNTAINDDILTISAPHKDTAYFGDADGRIFKTETGGVSFFQQVPDITTEISKLLFLDGSVGFAAGMGGILAKTTDGGETWTPKPTNSTYKITDLSFPNSQIGYASSENGIVFKSTDIGETWDSIPTGFNYDYRDIYFTSPDTGYVTSSDRILHTFDGGINWTEFDPNLSGIIQDIVFPSVNMGYCVGSSQIIKTEDAGLTWALATIVPGGSVYEMWFDNDSSGYITYTIGQRKTIDSCTTLISQGTICSTLGTMSSIEMLNGGDYGYAGGGAGGSTDGKIHQLETPEIIATQVSTGNFCAGAGIFVSFFGKGIYNTGNVFTAELSDASGSFASPTIIGSCTDLAGYFVYQSGVITATIPGGTPAGSGYRIRVISSDPGYIGPDNGFDIAIQSGQIPSVNLISATPGTICPGALLELNTSSSAGGLSPTYQWTVNGNPIQNNASSLFIDTLVNGDQVQVTLLSSLGCASPSSAISNVFTVSSSSSINIGLTADTSFCDTTTFQLNTTPGLTYEWSPTVGLSDSTIANPTATLTQSITYEVFVTNAAGCTDSDSIVILLSSTPEIITNDTSVCINSVLQLEATQGGVYTWTPGTGLNNPNIANPTATVTGNITYYLAVTSAEGCVNADSIQIVSNPLPVILSNDTTVCDATMLTLNATPGGIYSWTPLTGLSNPSDASPTATISGNITYYLNVTSAEGCVNNDSIVLLSNPLPEILSNDTIVCVNSTVQLSATTGGIYSWSPSIGLSNSTIENPTATLDSSNVYYLTVTSAEGCLNVDSIVLQTYPEPVITAVADTSICSGDCILLSPSINTGVQTVNWSTSVGLNDSTLLNPISCALNNISYIVSITDLNSCMASDTINVWVNPSPAVPVISFDGTSLTSTAENEYQWYLDGVTIPGADSIAFSPTQNGQYTIEVTNTDGCSEVSSSYSVSAIGINEYNLSESIDFYPNPVTDKFYLDFGSDYTEEVIVMVLDLNGKILKEKTILVQKGLEPVEINVKNLASGSYICHIVADSSLHIVHFVIE